MRAETKYRYALGASRWLVDKINASENLEEVRSIARQLVSMVEPDFIEDEWQDQLEEAGYYEEVSKKRPGTPIDTGSIQRRLAVSTDITLPQQEEVEEEAEGVQEVKVVPLNCWGKDHWSLLGYLMTRAFDYGPTFSVDPSRMRMNENRQPPRPPGDRSPGFVWSDAYSTRLRDHTAEDPVQEIGHDDWDCLMDMENEGLLEVVSIVNGIVMMHGRGLELGSMLMTHKAKGGTFAGFDPREPA